MTLTNSTGDIGHLWLVDNLDAVDAIFKVLCRIDAHVEGISCRVCIDECPIWVVIKVNAV